MEAPVHAMLRCMELTHRAPTLARMGERPTRAEIMDDPSADPREMARAFRFIRWVNRRLGGTAGLLGSLEAQRDRLGGSIRLLDVGTGCADVPLAALEWARRRGIAMRVVGVDLHDASLAEARQAVAAHPLTRGSPPEALEAPCSLLRANAFDLESHFSPGSFDVVHAGMFLHHFREDQVVELLAIMGRLATRLVIWNDLSRDRFSRFAVRCLTLPLPRIVRHDAVLSVDKGFLPAEVRELVRRASLPEPRISRRILGGRFIAVVPIARRDLTSVREAQEELDAAAGGGASTHALAPRARSTHACR